MKITGSPELRGEAQKIKAMNWKWFKLKSTLNILFLVALVLTVVGIVGVPLHRKNLENYVISIDEKGGNHFVSEEDVVGIVEQLKMANPNGNSLGGIDLKIIEDSLRAIDFVLDAQVSRDLKGNMVIDIRQDSPVARLLPESGEGVYISKDLDILGLSSNHAARVLLVSGSGADSLARPDFFQTEEGRQISELVSFINEDDFYRAQIAQLAIDKHFNIKVYPQVGQQVFEIGKAAGFQSKFKKMQVFYNEIIPKKGWAAYNLVKLQYKGQIVCR